MIAVRTLRMRAGPGVQALLACACLSLAAGAAAPALARPIIPQASVSITPATLTLAPGASAVFTAHPGGGEAIRFSVDWSVQEGAAGGAISEPAVAPDGSSSVTYTAPAGSGPFHLVAALHNQSAVRAVATITAPN